MGICMSCDAAAAGAYQPTAKLILHDGELREFPQPVKVSQALGDQEKCDLSSWFVCDADGMEFDEFVSSVDELRPGQIYFVLPSSMLRHPLHADDLAMLAVKASTALMHDVPPPSRSFRKRSVAPQPLMFADAPLAGAEFPPQPASPPLRRARRRMTGKGRDFASSLSVIPE